MEGHAKTYTIPHTAQPRGCFFKSSPVRALEPVFPPLGTPPARQRASYLGVHRPRMPHFSGASPQARGKASILKNERK